MKEGVLMEDMFDINKFDSYKEDNRREVKKANIEIDIFLTNLGILLKD